VSDVAFRLSEAKRSAITGREMASNVDLLTHAHKVVKSKKRQKFGQIKAVVFDEDARRYACNSINTL
jgi:hypothetical protein